MIFMWLSVTAMLMVSAAVLYVIEKDSGYSDKELRICAQMFFFAPVWPVVAVYALFLFSRYLYALIVDMWRSVRSSGESRSEAP